MALGVIAETISSPFEPLMEAISEKDLSSALEIAQIAALEAGQYLQKICGNVQVLHKKALRDNLLDADLRAEEIIIDILQKSFPTYSMLSEEAGEKYKNTPYMWVIDPLDGSFNFQHGSPTFGISISLRIDNITMLGVIYLPARDEMFTAIREDGAKLMLDNKTIPIQISETSTLDKAIILAGDFEKNGDYQENERRIANIGQLAHAVERVRMIGTAATDLAYIACGRADALIMHDTYLWDIDAGRLLVEEAGGRFTIGKDRSGKEIVIASNGILHEQLKDLLHVTEDENSDNR